MISLTPTGSPAETSQAFTLLEIIANPDRAKKHLESLVAEKQAAVEAMDNARAATKQAADDKAAADRKLAEASRKASESEAAHAVRNKQLDDHDAFLTTKQQRLDAFEEQLAKRETDVATREDAVKAREAELVEMETKAKDALKEAEEFRQITKPLPLVRASFWSRRTSP